MDITTKPANDGDYTVRLNRREANPHSTGPASLSTIVVSLPTPFPQQAARIQMDNVLWNAGLGRYSVCPTPRIESQKEWIERLLIRDRPRDPATGRFIAQGDSPQADLPLPSSISELNNQLAQVRIPKRQTKRRAK